VYSHARREAIKTSALYFGAPRKTPVIPAVSGLELAEGKTLAFIVVCVDDLRVCYRLLRSSVTRPGVVFGYRNFRIVPGLKVIESLSPQTIA
jgi:hypothetical protein